jgi:autotransporter passenger strand-loop-strand repeat protein
MVASGGQQAVNGRAAGTVMNAGGTELANPGGTTSGTVVNSGGTEIVYHNGTASGTTVSAGGFETLSGGGTARAPVSVVAASRACSTAALPAAR